MKTLRLLSLAAFAALLAVPAAALDTSAWEFRQTVTLDRAGPLRLSIPAETLDSARADLADLRLLGPDGAELPFAIVRRDTTRPSVERIPTQARVEPHGLVVEFGLAKARPLQRLRLEMPATDFVKSASVEVETADGRWQRVVDSALIFRMRGGIEQIALELRGTVGRTVRLTITDGDTPPVPITAVIIETGGAGPELLIDQPVTIAATEPEASATRLVLDLALRHRPIAELVLEAREGVFQRPVRLVAQRATDDEIVEDTLAAGTYLRLVFPGERRYAQLALPVDAVAPSARLELILENGDSPPLSDLRLTARLRSVDLGFEAPAAGTYTLLSGAPHAAAPRYDVAAFAADWGRLPAFAAPAAPRAANTGYRPAQLPAEVPEFAGPIDATPWRFHREVRLADSGAQVLELDVATLARSRNDLGDLRLVRGDRQVPYLLERTSRQRSLPLALVPAPDPERRTVGRWAVQLPVEGTPITSLRLTLNEPVFSRTVTVHEMVNDSRGQPWPRLLGDTSIVRRNTSDPATFTIALQSRPQTAQLYVEIDHGDNAAFAPVKVEAFYPVRRLRFRATETTGCVLLHGNPAANAPRYDLQLAAPRLLAVAPHTATLVGVDEAVESSFRLNLGGPFARYAFWGALAIVVAVLVWLVAKMLPKPPAA